MRPTAFFPRSQTPFGNVVVPETQFPPAAKQSFEDICVPKQSLGRG